jgi:hypothetical protein
LTSIKSHRSKRTGTPIEKKVKAPTYLMEMTQLRLPHDEEDGGNGKRAERGGHRTVCDVGNVVGNVGVADVLEEEFAFVANNPSCKGEQKLSKRRVDIEEVCSLQVV